MRMSSANHSLSKSQRPKVIKNNTLWLQKYSGSKLFLAPYVSIFVVNLGNKSQTNFAYIKKLI